MQPGTARESTEARGPGRARTRRLVLLGVILVGLLVVLFAFQAARTALALREARAQATLLQQQVSSGDLVAARVSARGLLKNAASAHRSSANLLWDAAAKTPVFGRNVEAVQLISFALDEVARDSLPAGLDLVETARTGAFQSKNGSINLAQVRQAAPGVEKAARAARSADRALTRIEPDRLLSPLQAPVAELRDKFAELDRAVGSAASATRLLPGMLG